MLVAHEPAVFEDPVEQRARRLVGSLLTLQCGFIHGSVLQLVSQWSAAQLRAVLGVGVGPGKAELRA